MFGARKLRDYATQKTKIAIDGLRGYRIEGLPRCAVTVTAERSVPRLNILIGRIRKSSIFGGSATALRFFQALRPHFAQSRILVLDEAEADFEPSNWPGWTLRTGPQSIAYLSEPGVSPEVGPDDHFIATHWRTAHYVQDVMRMFAARGLTSRRYPYLIQDFEPGFYSWSSRYLLASATYTDRERAIAVFNTRMLEQFFARSGFDFVDSYIFEPALNPALAKRQPAASRHAKRKLLLVYGRPTSSRNAFDLVVEALLAWARDYHGADRWELVSLGEAHRDIRLSRGIFLRSKGNVALEEYGDWLLDASVGLSLMVSPHPSYPPMEMAEFGVRVVTNEFANKNLSERSANIISVLNATPDNLSKALIECCEAHERGEPREFGRRVFLGGAEEFPFASELAERMLLSEVAGIPSFVA